MQYLLDSEQLEHGCMPSHFDFLIRHSSHARAVLLPLFLFCGGSTFASDSAILDRKHDALILIECERNRPCLEKRSVALCQLVQFPFSKSMAIWANLSTMHRDVNSQVQGSWPTKISNCRAIRLGTCLSNPTFHPRIPFL